VLHGSRRGPRGVRGALQRHPRRALTGDAHFVDGDRGASEWTLSGRTTDGQRIEVRGCDLWTFRDGRICRKDSFWKIQTD
jgi:ketosteroid isomerase-like protein